MSIVSLTLKKFRNFSEETLLLKGSFHIFVGPNAQGKTNVIEALHLLAFGKSFRVANYRDTIQWGVAHAFIKTITQTDLGEEVRETHLNSDKKIFLKNGKPTRPNQFNSMPLVLFAPEEILLLKSPPSMRRDYIDHLFIKLSPIYGDNLRRYNLALHHRNNLLKNKELDRRSLENEIRFWEEPLGQYGDILVLERRRLIEELNPILRERYNIIAGGAAREAQFVYQPNQETFEKRREDELIRGFTIVGPHRDEFIPSLSQEPISHAGSQGEMRTFTLALKLSEIKLFEHVLEKTPILLLDDVMSELDTNRSRFFFDYLDQFQGQIFATATSLDLFPKRAQIRAKVWMVENGTIRALDRS